MGSRKQQNFGGSGKPKTRVDWVQHKKTFIPIHPGQPPFENIEDVRSYFEQDKLFCFECGLYFNSLGHHLSKAHAMSSAYYKKKYNIPSTYGLSGRILREKKRAITKQIWQNPKMEEVRKKLKSKEATEKRCCASIKICRGAEKKLYQKYHKAICIGCGEDFTYHNISANRKYCSKKCEGKYNKERLILIAKKGGKTRKEKGIKDSRGRFIG